MILLILIFFILIFIIFFFILKNYFDELREEKRIKLKSDLFDRINYLFLVEEEVAILIGVLEHDLETGNFWREKEKLEKLLNDLKVTKDEIDLEVEEANKVLKEDLSLSPEVLKFRNNRIKYEYSKEERDEAKFHFKFRRHQR